MTDPRDRSFSGPDAEIMRATHRALREHGYADLTVQRIADEYGKTTAAVHYHYDTKEDLLAAFLDYLLDRFVETVHEVETTDPERRLDLLLDKLLVDLADHEDLLVAMLEMRSQAPYDEAFGDRLEQNDEYIRYLLRTVVEDGIRRGAFADVDAERAARTLATIVDGAQTRAAVRRDGETLAAARRSADEYVSAVLRPGGGATDAGATDEADATDDADATGNDRGGADESGADGSEADGSGADAS